MLRRRAYLLFSLGIPPPPPPPPTAGVSLESTRQRAAPAPSPSSSSSSSSSAAAGPPPGPGDQSTPPTQNPPKRCTSPLPAAKAMVDFAPADTHAAFIEASFSHLSVRQRERPAAGNARSNIHTHPHSGGSSASSSSTLCLPKQRIRPMAPLAIPSAFFGCSGGGGAGYMSTSAPLLTDTLAHACFTVRPPTAPAKDNNTSGGVGGMGLEHLLADADFLARLLCDIVCGMAADDGSGPMLEVQTLLHDYEDLENVSMSKLCRYPGKARPKAELFPMRAAFSNFLTTSAGRLREAADQAYRLGAAAAAPGDLMPLRVLNMRVRMLLSNVFIALEGHLLESPESLAARTATTSDTTGPNDDGNSTGNILPNTTTGSRVHGDMDGDFERLCLGLPWLSLLLTPPFCVKGATTPVPQLYDAMRLARYLKTDHFTPIRKLWRPVLRPPPGSGSTTSGGLHGGASSDVPGIIPDGTFSDQLCALDVALRRPQVIDVWRPPFVALCEAFEQRRLFVPTTPEAWREARGVDPRENDDEHVNNKSGGSSYCDQSCGGDGSPGSAVTAAASTRMPACDDALLQSFELLTFVPAAVLRGVLAFGTPFLDGIAHDLHAMARTITAAARANHRSPQTSVRGPPPAAAVGYVNKSPYTTTGNPTGISGIGPAGAALFGDDPMQCCGGVAMVEVAKRVAAVPLSTFTNRKGGPVFAAPPPPPPHVLSQMVAGPRDPLGGGLRYKLHPAYYPKPLWAPREEAAEEVARMKHAFNSKDRSERGVRESRAYEEKRRHLERSLHHENVFHDPDVLAYYIFDHLPDDAVSLTDLRHIISPEAQMGATVSAKFFSKYPNLFRNVTPVGRQRLHIQRTDSVAPVGTSFAEEGDESLVLLLLQAIREDKDAARPPAGKAALELESLDGARLLSLHCTMARTGRAFRNALIDRFGSLTKLLERFPEYFTYVGEEETIICQQDILYTLTIASFSDFQRGLRVRSKRTGGRFQ